MGRRVEAAVKPELLVWARKSARRSIAEAAKKAGVTAERVEAWERGEQSCTVGQLRKLAALYKRPLAVFYLPEPPRDFDALRDFRRIPTQLDYEESPELAAEIRWAYQMREIAKEVFTLADLDLPDFALEGRLSEASTTVAARIRGALGLGLEQQHEWQNAYQAMDGWRSAIEKLGVICLQFSGVSVREARGFSIADDRLPVIAVNAKDAPTARIFSMLHEFAHLMLGESGKCDLHETTDSPSEIDRVEVFCNQVAGETLVPEGDLRRTAAVQHHRGGAAWDADELADLRLRYNVSEEVVVRRLLALGLTNRAFYRRKREEYLSNADKKPSTGGDYYRNKRVKLGRPLIVGVMSALQQGRISANDASAYLEVKVPRLQRLLQSAIG